MLKMYVLCLAVLFSSGCFGPRYIPARYFAEKHSMAVAVQSLLSPSHNLTHVYESDPIKKLEKGLESANRTIQMQSVFSKIDTEVIHDELKKDIEARAAKVFGATSDPNDLLLEIRINDWGWIVPSPGPFGIGAGEFELIVNGSALVYDMHPTKKLIASTSFRGKENISDHMSASETQKAIKKVMGQFAKHVGEFLWQREIKE